ncbi:MAG TPA: diacylglycerol kinase family protein [Novosphingobium sp.]|nr:diacylglycerol kinase family protein [Novosphingobium sp.]
MEAPRVIWLIVNEASGSNDEIAIDQVIAALEVAGATPARVIRLPADDLPDREALDHGSVDGLVTFTGDGTANAVVSRLEGWRGAVLVLPGGTQNLLARALHGEADAASIVAALGRGELNPTRRHLIRSRHGDGLCEIVAGPGAKWSEVREALREGAMGDLAAAAGEAISQTSSGPKVVVAAPPLGEPEGYPAVRLHPVGDRIAVDGYRAETIADYARQGLAILARDYRQGPHDELGRHRAVVCRSAEPIELMIDGERATGGTVERFVVTACEVTLLASASRDPP